MSGCQLNDDSCLRGSVALHQSDGSEGVGRSANGMPLMAGIPEIVNSEGVTVSEIGETFASDTEIKKDVDRVFAKLNADFQARVPTPTAVTMFFGFIFSQLKNE